VSAQNDGRGQRVDVGAGSGAPPRAPCSGGHASRGDARTAARPSDDVCAMPKSTRTASYDRRHRGVAVEVGERSLPRRAAGRPAGKTFAGFRSRCTMCRSCSARRPTRECPADSASARPARKRHTRRSVRDRAPNEVRQHEVGAAANPSRSPGNTALAVVQALEQARLALPASLEHPRFFGDSVRLSFGPVTTVLAAAAPWSREPHRRPCRRCPAA